MVLVFHVDKIYDDDTADIPETQLISDLSCSLHIGFENRLVQIVFTDETACIDINDRQGFGAFDYDIST